MKKTTAFFAVMLLAMTANQTSAVTLQLEAHINSGGSMFCFVLGCQTGDSLLFEFTLDNSLVVSDTAGSATLADVQGDMAFATLFLPFHPSTLTMLESQAPYNIFDVSWDEAGNITSFDFWWTGSFSPHFIWNTGVAGVGTGVVVHEQNCDTATNTGACGLISDPNLATSVVPVPATAYLFGSALLGLVGLKRRAK